MNLKVQKRLIDISSIILLLLGAFWITFTSTILDQNKDIQLSSSLKAFQALLIKAIVFGCLLVIWSILGLASSLKKLDALQGIYIFGIPLLLMVSISMLVVSVIIFTIIPDYKSDTDCTQKSMFIDFAQLNTQSYQTLCQADCLCNFEGLQEQASQQSIHNFNNNSGSVRVQQCSEFQNFGKYSQMGQVVSYVHQRPNRLYVHHIFYGILFTLNDRSNLLKCNE
ncbi:hypothetical protein ABPG72_004004 [Tetrahymena utriculariae]